MLSKYTVQVSGVAPLLMHNGQTADPLNPFAKRMKAISSKRKKTEEDYSALADIEWEAGLYTDENGEVCLPSHVVSAAIRDGAKKSKNGKAFGPAVFVEGDAHLDIGRKRTVEKLRDDPKFRDARNVRVGQSRVVRTRPRFDEWGAKFTVLLDTELIEPDTLRKAIDDCGAQVGFGDYRPQYGRFLVESFDSA